MPEVICAKRTAHSLPHAQQSRLCIGSGRVADMAWFVLHLRPTVLSSVGINRGLGSFRI